MLRREISAGLPPWPSDCTLSNEARDFLARLLKVRRGPPLPGENAAEWMTRLLERRWIRFCASRRRRPSSTPGSPARLRASCSPLVRAAADWRGHLRL